MGERYRKDESARCFLTAGGKLSPTWHPTVRCFTKLSINQQQQLGNTKKTKNWKDRILCSSKFLRCVLLEKIQNHNQHYKWIHTVMVTELTMFSVSSQTTSIVTKFSFRETLALIWTLKLMRRIPVRIYFLLGLTGPTLSIFTNTIEELDLQMKDKCSAFMFLKLIISENIGLWYNTWLYYCVYTHTDTDLINLWQHQIKLILQI